MTPATIPTSINGRWTIDLLPHRATLPEWEHGWEPERWASIYELTAPGQTIIDIGAEQGDLTALMASWGLRVGIIEAAPAYWPNIRATFEANGLRPAACFPGFADDHTDRAARRLRTLSNWPYAASGPIYTDHGFVRPEERPDIPHVTLDEFCLRARLRPDAITMDVEGSEIRVLQGASLVLDTFRPLVWVSVHPAFIEAHYGQTAADLYALMSSHSYTFHHLATDHEEHVLFCPSERPL